MEVREFDRRIAGELPRLGDSLRLPRGNPVFYEDESRRINVEGQISGLPDDVRRLYILLFTDYAGDFQLQREFDRQLKLYLENLGVDAGAPLSEAQAIVGGTIASFNATDSRRVTNIDGLVYTLKIDFNVARPSGQPISQQRGIEERLIVADTNAYTTNEIIPMMADSAAKHVAEAIRYGWQLSSEWSRQHTPVLGSIHDNDSSTNRAE